MRSSIPMSFGEKTQPDFSFSRSVGGKRSVCPEHWHDCFEIIFVKKGGIKLVRRGAEVMLADGDVAVIPPGTLHGTDAGEQEREIYVFGYTESLIYSPDVSLDNMKYLVPFRRIGGSECRVLRAGDEKSAELGELLETAMALYQRDGFERELCVRAAILRIHAVICGIYVSHGGSYAAKSAYVTSAQMYVEQRIHENISPYDVAAALHISYSHLSRVVRESLGYSVGELILRMKLSRAERLMTANPDAGITEIASSVGFNSASYFTRCFRRVRGITPVKFRGMLRQGGV